MRLSETTLQEQALQVTQFALDGQMGIVETAHSLMSLLRSYPDLVSQDDFNLIRAIETETDHLPIGRVRALWHPDYLPAKDREIERCDKLWHDRMLPACERIRRALLLRKLILNGHLNVSERGVIEPAGRNEVAAAVKSILLEEGVFPIAGREGVVY
jgi:hypothetical protein